MSSLLGIGAADRLHLVVAFDQVGGIGKDGKIPWCLPADLKRFKEITTSLPQTAMPGSFNVVIMVILEVLLNAFLCFFSNRYCRAGRLGNLCPPDHSHWLDASTSSYPPILNLCFLLVLCLPLISNQQSTQRGKFLFTIKSLSSEAKAFMLQRSLQERSATSPQLLSTFFLAQTCTFCYLDCPRCFFCSI